MSRTRASEERTWGAAMAPAEAGEESDGDILREIRKMMMGLTAQMGDVREDISTVRKDLGYQIDKGRNETEELRKRIEHNENTFADRVAAVISGMPQPPGYPVFSDSNQSDSAKSYASCFASDPWGRRCRICHVSSPGRPKRTNTGNVEEVFAFGLFLGRMMGPSWRLPSRLSWRIGSG